MLIAVEVIYNFAMFSIKASILYLYKRVFFVSRSFVVILWVVGIFVGCYSIAQTFAAIFVRALFPSPSFRQPLYLPSQNPPYI